MELKFWKVNCGDAISVRYLGIDNKYMNLLIDSGYIGTYKATIREELREIQARKEQVDLWILTHTDLDHIGGVTAFIKDNYVLDKNNLIKQFWFNWSDYRIHPSRTKIGAKHGILLRDYLSKWGKLADVDLTNDLPISDLNGLAITLLSPDLLSLEASKILWDKYERKLIKSSLSDHRKSIDELKLSVFDEDDNKWNGSSIAFMATLEDKTVLLLADSHPTIVCAKLRSFGYSSLPEKRLKVDLVKLSHHASKGNTSPELISLLDCSNYVISANGISNSLPNKTTLAWILTNPNRNMEVPVNFYFNHGSEALRKLFSLEDEKKYNFTCKFPEDSESFLKIVVL